MIFQVTMYSGKCDNCQESFEAPHTGYCAFVDEGSCRDEMINRSDNNWTEQVINGKRKHYCPECYSFDSNDKLMLNTSRKVEPKVYSRDECVFQYCASPELCKEKNACCNG